MNIYNYYTMDCNKLEKIFGKQNESNIKLKLELEAIKAQFEKVSDYFKKNCCKIEQLKLVID